MDQYVTQDEKTIEGTIKTQPDQTQFIVPNDRNNTDNAYFTNNVDVTFQNGFSQNLEESMYLVRNDCSGTENLRVCSPSIINNNSSNEKQSDGHDQNPIDDSQVLKEIYRTIEKTPLGIVVECSVSKYGLLETSLTNGTGTSNQLVSRKSATQSFETNSETKKQHICTTCNKSFSRNYNLQLHMRIHTGDKRYTCTCTTCGKHFSRRTDLRKHERIHTGEKPYACKTCGKRFTEISHLIAHEKIHTGEKSYVCDTCDKRFNRSCNLRRHEKMHSSGWKMYSCSICYKSFGQASELRRHERVHTGDKPYVCGVCNKAYSDVGSIHYHQKLHSGEEKEYICGICGKDFYVCHKLLVHLRQHTGEKAHYCRTCGKGFTKKRNWIKHEAVKHVKETLVPEISEQLEKHIVSPQDSSV